jgi:hypothetical protein
MLGRCAEELSKFLGIKRDEVLKINQVTHVDSNETLLAFKAHEYDFPIFPFYWGKLPF